MIPIDDVVHFDCITSGSTGAAVDADSTPTFSVFEEDTDTPILSAQNFTKRTSLTGNYRGSFTASAANGFEAGKWYSVIASATVSSVAGKTVALGFRIAPAETVAGVPKTDVSHWLGGGVATPTVTGVPEVDITHLVGASQSATDLKDFADDGYDPVTNKVQGVVLVDTLTTYTGNTLQTGDSFARLGAPAGASVSADIAAVEAQTDDIGVAGVGLTDIPWNTAWNTEVFTQAEGALIATFDFVGQQPKVLLDSISVAAKALIQTEVQDAIEANHLDHLLAADYDPASKPGVSTALLNEIIGSDAGVSQFTTNALELAPSGGSAPTAAAIADAVWDENLLSHVAVGSTGEALDAVSQSIAPTTAAIDAALSAAHGAGAWGAGAGSGAFAITVTVNDGAVGLQNVNVGIYDGATLSASGVTSGVAGQATFSLNTGTYTVNLVKAGYTFTPTTRTVTGNQTGTLTTALTMTAVSTPSPSDPSLCVLSGFLKDLNGNDLVGSQLKARLVPQFPNRPLTANGNVVALESDTAISDANGFVSMELIRTDGIDQHCTYTIKCLDAGIEARNVILAAATKDIATL